MKTLKTYKQLFESDSYKTVSDYNNMILINKTWHHGEETFFSQHKIHFILHDMVINYDRQDKLSANGNNVFYHNHNRMYLNPSYVTFDLSDDSDYGDNIKNTEKLTLDEFFNKYQEQAIQIYSELSEKYEDTEIIQDIRDEYKKIIDFLEQIPELKKMADIRKKKTDFNL